MRRRLKDYEAKQLGLKLLKSDGYGWPKYRITEDQEQQLKEIRAKDPTPNRVWGLDENNKLLPLEDYCELYNLPIEDVVSSKIITHTGTPYWNITFKENRNVEDRIDVLETLSKHTFNKIKTKPPKGSIDCFDRLILTDIHIGMNPDNEGVAMYCNKWGTREINKAKEKIVHEASKRKRGNVLVIEQLGDLLDGFNAKTTRGGHDLPQNMSNQEQFDTAVSFLCDIVRSLADYYLEIHLHNVCNDNHAGDFGYMACQAVKHILEASFEGVYVTNHVSFMSHYSVDGHLSVISHGKDKVHNKFGFKPFLDAKQIEKIDQYIKYYDLYKYKYIRFAKGDSHQAVFDDTTSNDFSYCNYPSLAPASEWVQSNFKNSKRGFALENEEYETGIVNRAMIYL